MIRRRTSDVLVVLIVLGAFSSLWVAGTRLDGNEATLFALLTFAIEYVAILLVDLSVREEP
jgi:hypothetical protein